MSRSTSNTEDSAGSGSAGGTANLWLIEICELVDRRVGRKPAVP
jgi:hypothetical protein